MKKLEWTHVAVIAALLAVMGALSYLGKPTEAMLGAVLAVLAAFGFGFLNNKQNEIMEKQHEINATTGAIKEQTNGRIGELTALVEQALRGQQTMADQHRRDLKEMADKMASMTPAAPVEPVSGLGGESHASDVPMAAEAGWQTR